jgi:methionyl-tRNA formyltransferase
MKIVILVSGEKGRRCLQSLYECVSNEDQVVVFTFLESPWEPHYVKSIKDLARKHKSSFYITSKLQDDKYKKIWLKGVDVILAIGWRYLIPLEVYKSAKKSCYIFHDSYLPKNRGFSPTVWSIRNGEKYTGITVFKISEKVDDGPILFQEKILIGNEEYISEILEKVIEKCESLIKKVYRSVKSNNLVLFNQNDNDASFTCKLMPHDFRIDWSKDATEIFNLIRSYSFPYPGTFAFFQKKKIYIYAASIELIPLYSGYVEGRVASINIDSSVTIFCGNSTAIKLIDISTDGKSIIKPNDIIKSIGDSFE